MEVGWALKNLVQILRVVDSKFAINSQQTNHTWTQLYDLFDFPSFDARQDWCTVHHLFRVLACFKGIKHERSVLQSEALLRMLLAVLDKPVGVLSLTRGLLL